MADVYYIRIGLVDGTRVVLHCLTGFTSDGRNYETSRSFALSVLLDAKVHCDDHEYLCQGAPELVCCPRELFGAAWGWTTGFGRGSPCPAA